MIWIAIIAFVVLPLMVLVFFYCLCKSGAWADEQMEMQFYEMEEREAIPFYVEEVEYDNEYGNVMV